MALAGSALLAQAFVLEQPLPLALALLAGVEIALQLPALGFHARPVLGSLAFDLGVETAPALDLLRCPLALGVGSLVRQANLRSLMRAIHFWNGRFPAHDRADGDWTDGGRSEREAQTGHDGQPPPKHARSRISAGIGIA